eukprot:CAMPEP_0183293490 /NCGR_PEP_ID=MMETSP0160_2-20130417/2157_1 /TAXON_ID=2839 ORGANISM="Odontella Sinensis, Strain Grunow 1884" /NCGR_SAMPLE_ID=MMETSP0160_2 /ASSEMBLY_ACC=CAM_ASM_000250 /LENGTH=52 /DNA_ID=CAMNT_0025454613 /DNA_START=103 /DNA_END=257 /DNA_ORIENTATION=+
MRLSSRLLLLALAGFGPSASAFAPQHHRLSAFSPRGVLRPSTSLAAAPLPPP